MPATTIQDPLETIGPAIARHFPGWHPTIAGHHSHYLIQDTTPEPFDPFRSNALAIHLKHDRGRLVISGDWPVDHAHGRRIMTPSQIGEQSPTITCAIDRPPEKIAAEISRRFAQKYMDLHARCLERIAQDNAMEHAQLLVAGDFSAIMGEKGHDPKSTAVRFYGRDCYGHVAVNSGGDTATMELRGKVEILKAALTAAGLAGAFIR